MNKKLGLYTLVFVLFATSPITTHAKIKAVVFDFIGVLADKTRSKYFKPVVSVMHRTNAFQNDFMTGKYDAKKAFQKILDEGLKKKSSLCKTQSASILREYWNGIDKHLSRIESGIKLLKDANAAGLKVYVLSNLPAAFWLKIITSKELNKNTNKPKWGFLNTSEGDFKMVDGAFISGIFKQKKPEEDLYNTLFETTGLQPHECLFLDDKKENVDAGANLGMPGFVWTKPQKTVHFGSGTYTIPTKSGMYKKEGDSRGHITFLKNNLSEKQFRIINKHLHSGLQYIPAKKVPLKAK